MLKKIWIKYLINKNEKKRDIESNLDFNKSKKIALIFTHSNAINLENIDEIISDVRAERKEISVIAYVKDKRKSTISFPQFDSKDITLFGKMKSEHLDFFMNQTYDLILCPDKNENYLVDYLLSQIKTKCRVGMTDTKRHNHYEMIIKSEIPDELDSKEILKYLKMIQSNEH